MEYWLFQPALCRLSSASWWSLQIAIKVISYPVFVVRARYYPNWQPSTSLYDSKYCVSWPKPRLTCTYSSRYASTTVTTPTLYISTYTSIIWPLLTRWYLQDLPHWNTITLARRGIVGFTLFYKTIQRPPERVYGPRTVFLFLKALDVACTLWVSVYYLDQVMVLNKCAVVRFYKVITLWAHPDRSATTVYFFIT